MCSLHIDILQVMTALSVVVLVLPASAHAVLREWERQTWFAEVHHWLEHRPFCVETSVSQHPRTPAQVCTVIGIAYIASNVCKWQAKGLSTHRLTVTTYDCTNALHRQYLCFVSLYHENAIHVCLSIALMIPTLTTDKKSTRQLTSLLKLIIVYLCWTSRCKVSSPEAPTCLRTRSPGFRLSACWKECAAPEEHSHTT